MAQQGAILSGHMGLWKFATEAVFSKETLFATLGVTRDWI
jgi:hypothetical protein